MEESRGDVYFGYKFTGKELDPETGLYYFGARYYEPRISVWISPDPILDEYLDGSPNGGVYHHQNLGAYTYTYNNPVKMTDPDGRCPVVNGFFDCTSGPIQQHNDLVSGIGQDISSGNYGNAAIGSALYFGSGSYVLLSYGAQAVAEIWNSPYAIFRGIVDGDPVMALNGVAGTALLLTGPAAAWELRALRGASGGLAPKAVEPKPLRGAANPKNQEVLKKGKLEHDILKEKVKTKAEKTGRDWKSEPSLIDPATGKTAKPDVVTPSGKPIELKPNTPSGRKAGESQLNKYIRATGRDPSKPGQGRVIYYDPKK